MTTNESPAALLPEGRRIAIARDEFFASLSGATLSGAPTGVYLRNRLELAFIEGWKAAKLDASTAPVASESRGSVPEHLTVSMCRSYDYAAGWNACRDAMLAAAPTPPAVASGEPPDWAIVEVVRDHPYTFKDALRLAKNRARSAAAKGEG